MTDWTDKAQVCALAKSFGKGHTVYQKIGEPTYRIVHTENTHIWGKIGHRLILRT